MTKFSMEKRDRDDGTCYYEVMILNPPDTYRCICTVDEEIGIPGQAFMDARLIVAALQAFNKE